MRFKVILIIIVIFGNLNAQPNPPLTDTLSKEGAQENKYIICRFPYYDSVAQKDYERYERYKANNNLDSALLMTSKYIGVFPDYDGYTPSYWCNNFLELVKEKYSQNEIELYQRNIDIVIKGEEFILALLSEDLPDYETFQSTEKKENFLGERWNGTANVYIKFDNLLIEIWSNSLEEREYYYMLKSYSGSKEDKNRFRDRMNEVWMSSRLYTELQTLYRDE